MTDDGHQSYESVKNMQRGAEENEGFLEYTMFPDEATFEITGKLSH
jgi:hypothetical protein